MEQKEHYRHPGRDPKRDLCGSLHHRFGLFGLFHLYKILEFRFFLLTLLCRAFVSAAQILHFLVIRIRSARNLRNMVQEFKFLFRQFSLCHKDSI